MRYLRKFNDGYVYPYTDALAKRVDMVECDKDGRRIFEEGQEPNPLENTKEIKIFNKNFDVPEYLVPTVEKLLEVNPEVKPPEPKTEMVLNGNKYQVPNSMVEDIAAIGDRMVDAEKANGDLQKQLSDQIAANKKLEKEKAAVEEDKAGLEREIKSLNKEIKKLKE